MVFLAFQGHTTFQKTPKRRLIWQFLAFLKQHVTDSEKKIKLSITLEKKLCQIEVFLFTSNEKKMQLFTGKKGTIEEATVGPSFIKSVTKKMTAEDAIKMFLLPGHAALHKPICRGFEQHSCIILSCVCVQVFERPTCGCSTEQRKKKKNCRDFT